ncbi:MAG: hypothetical protein E6H68_00255, partial [Betaproteobacteria bacterium]
MGKRIDADDTKLLLSGFWAINALLFDYRPIINRTTITVKGDYRKTGRLSTNGGPVGTKNDRRKAGSPALRSNVDSLNEFECQLPDGWPHQQSQCESVPRARCPFDPNGLAPQPIHFLLVRRDAPYEVFIVIAVRLDR